jgi:hypothetical protein
MNRSTTGDVFGEQSVSQRVIEAVADETGREPTEVGPLYHVVDPDALDRLFTPTRGNVRRRGRVEFTFAGCDVAVCENGEVTVSERDVLADSTDADVTDAADRAGVTADGTDAASPTGTTADYDETA